MSMTNRDTQERERIQRAVNLAQALRGDDEDAVKQALVEYADGIQQNILRDAELYAEQADSTVLAGRGLRQLTNEEKSFYQRAIEAIKADPKQSFNPEDMRMPESVIESILGDVTTEHPLLEAISITPTSALTTWVINKQGPQAAVWGEITAEIVQELFGKAGFESVNLAKLSAFFPVSLALLELGPEWLDRYIREVCTEAIALGLENAVIDGSGISCPVGMTRNITGDFSAENGYPRKEAIAVTTFSPEEYGVLASNVAVDDLGKARNVSDLILVVNPLDYLSIVMPATIRQTIDGGYIRDVLPLPTHIIQSASVTRGQAILGLATRYFCGVGNGTDGGRIDNSDHVRFIYDQRVYKVKLYAIGKPMDNNAFIVLNITNLMRDIPAVSTVLPDTAQVMSLLTVTSDAGTAVGDTAITVTEAKLSAANTYKYKVVTNGVSLPVVGTKLTGTGWTAWDGAADITAATDSYIVIAELDGTTVAATGYAIVTARA